MTNAQNLALLRRKIKSTIKKGERSKGKLNGTNLRRNGPKSKGNNQGTKKRAPRPGNNDQPINAPAGQNNQPEGKGSGDIGPGSVGGGSDTPTAGAQ